MESQVQSPSDVTHDTLQSGEMRLPRIMHMKAYLLYIIGDVQLGKGEALQSTSETLECYGISHTYTRES